MRPTLNQLLLIAFRLPWLGYHLRVFGTTTYLTVAAANSVSDDVVGAVYYQFFTESSADALAVLFFGPVLQLELAETL